MRPLDWAVMFAWLAFLVGYGIWRGRGSNSVNQFLLAGKTMPWYAMGLSIMATQASAITFISTTAQSYVDGMRFVQFYLGLPIAMVILSATAVPIFHRANVYTAYEYLEYRFDSRTRLLVTIVFLIQRGLAAGLGLSAPAIVMSVILGWPFRVTVVIMGSLVVLFTTLGGIKAVTWADVLQMTVIMSALIVALIIGVRSMPSDVSFLDAIKLAGAAGKLNAITTRFDWNDRYNLWSGLIGGTCLMLAYFGCDQSQVQRYLAGRSIAQSRISLLFNAMAKVPVQFFILFIGAMVFVFFLFERPPLLFHPAELARAQQAPEYAGIEARYDQAFEERRTAARGLKVAGDPATRANALASFQSAQSEMDQARATAMHLTQESDTNYIFLSFVTHYLPVGLVGLIIAVIFTAAMVSIAGEINSLATVTLIDIYRRYFHREGTDAHYLGFSRWATVFWGLYAVAFAATARGFGALIEAVNQVGSLFYGGLLGVFVLAFFFKSVGPRGAFYGVLAGQAVIFAAAKFTNVAYLWYTIIGALVVIAVGWSAPEPRKA
ncbi:MAG TPA: sodium:solute symporter [Bryobacteraceae bacterium]|nr:sodium:solute symporter [Bryobacteraceae bacterium]